MANHPDPYIPLARATDAATAWLRLMDDDQFQQAWEACSQYLQSHINAADWGRETSSVRQQTGKCIQRILVSAAYAPSLPDMPSGPYFVSVFETQCSAATSIQETVTLKQDEDGCWRPAGYFVNG